MSKILHYLGKPETI